MLRKQLYSVHSETTVVTPYSALQVLEELGGE